MKKTTLMTALLVALSASALVQAATPAATTAAKPAAAVKAAGKAAPNDKNLPPALVGAMRTGVTIEKTFAAESGMTGYVLNRNGQFSIVFATPDKQTLVNGILIAADGHNTAPEYEDKYIPKPNLDALWPQLEKAAVVVTGAKGSAVKAVVYAFIDPNCSYCHLAWKAFKPYEETGLQVRWLPVAFLGPTSTPKSASFMQAADQGAALDALEENFKNGGVDAKTLAGVVVKPDTVAKLEANSKVMKSFGFGGTPAMIWRDKAGKVLSKNGMPRLSELPGMFNLPAVPNSDAELERFQ